MWEGRFDEDAQSNFQKNFQELQSEPDRLKLAHFNLQRWN